MKHHVNHLNAIWKYNDMERRRFMRFRAQKDAFAALQGKFSKVGKIYDICLNGLAFRYLAEKIYDETFTQVDIFLSNNGFHLAGVPCTIIYDLKESTLSLNKVSPYRCGLKFERFNEEQQNRLEFFINHHTIEVLPYKG